MKQLERQYGSFKISIEIGTSPQKKVLTHHRSIITDNCAGGKFATSR